MTISEQCLIPLDDLVDVIDKWQLQSLADCVTGCGPLFSADMWHQHGVEFETLGPAATDWRTVMDWDFAPYNVVVTWFELYDTPNTIYHFKMTDGSIWSFPFRFRDGEWQPMDTFSMLLPDGRAGVCWNGHHECAHDDDVRELVNDRDRVQTQSILTIGSLSLYVNEKLAGQETSQ